MKYKRENRINREARLAGMLFALFLIAPTAYGESALEVVRKVDQKQYTDTAEQKMVMQIYPSLASDTGRREFSIRSLSLGADDSYMEFEEPRTIKGMKILSKGDDRYVFFPSTGRVRKIAGESKKQSVQGVGGDFSYEDLGGGTIEDDYRVSLLEETPSLYRLEGIPVQGDSVYSKVIFEIDKTRYLPVKIEYYTEEDGHLKDLHFSGFTNMGGKEIATEMEMINLQKESKTEVRVVEAVFDRPVDEKKFNPTRFYR